MNWNEELVTSAYWLIQAFFISISLFSLFVFCMVKWTNWGKQFWQLARDDFNPKHHRLFILLLSTIILLSLINVRINVVMSNWYNAMYASLQALDEARFWQMMGIFAIIATISVILALVSYYLSQRFTIQWRQSLNHRFVERWMSNRTYYKSQYIDEQIDNPDQRIQHDISAFVSSSLGFTTGLISAVNSIIAFTLLLWTLSGPTTLLGITIPKGMVFIAFIYVLLTSLIAFKLGRPLINLNFLNEKLNANFRYSLIRIKEYAESIAFYRGESTEKNHLHRRFDQVIENVWQIVYRTLKFSGFNLIVSQTSVVFPFLLQAGRFFKQQMNLGDLMQTANVFGQLHTNLSFFRNSYDDFAAYKATLDRLTGFQQAIQQAENMTPVQIQEHPTDVIVKQLTISTPSQQSLIQQLNLQLTCGDTLLIQGSSGVGKTTLLRTLAGVWPFAKGDIAVPVNRLFLSQKPYLPQGTIRDALYYPAHAPTQDNDEIEHAILMEVHLAHLIPMLHEENSWSQILSLGEQQRLAFARLLISRPQVVFLDEASASMDEGLEYNMYQLLRNKLPNTTVISVGHRSTLKPFHKYYLSLEPQGVWYWNDTTQD